MADLTGFLTFEQMHSKSNIGSSRIRAEWPVKYWPESELFIIGKKYTTVIFQKAYWIDYAKIFPGTKILDVCDPDFLQWDSPCKLMADLCDAVTTSTPALADAMARYTTTPVFCIPDRVDFECIVGLRKNHHTAGNVPTVAWYGYSTNFASLDAAVESLLSLGIGHLIVIATPDKPYELPAHIKGRIMVTNYDWTRDTIHDHLLKADVVLNFRRTVGRWKYKSNNKTILAWALGLPVAHSAEELASLMSVTARLHESERRYAEVRRDWDVRQTVVEFKELIHTLRNAI